MKLIHKILCNLFGHPSNQTYYIGAGEYFCFRCGKKFI